MNTNEDFSRPAFSTKVDGDKRTMAATAGEGTAPKLGSGKCGGPTSATNSRVRVDVTAGETANFPNPSNTGEEAQPFHPQGCSAAAPNLNRYFPMKLIRQIKTFLEFIGRMTPAEYRCGPKLAWWLAKHYNP